MNELIQQMKVVLASSFALYLKTHNFHWNVEGPNFPQYHDFLNNMYNEIWLAVDAIAEHIRALDAYAPGSLSRYSQLSVVDDQLNIPLAKAMLAELESDNIKLISELNKALRLAEAANKHGLANFIQDRIDIHEKHRWMLKATGK